LEEIDLIFSSDIGYFDVSSHHLQTAASTLAHMEKVQRKDANRYPFQLGETGPHLPASLDNKSLPPCDEYKDIRHPTVAETEINH
jgi:hypothetical protein